MFKYYNANPFGRRIQDCTIRAISFATNRSWKDTFEELCSYAAERCIMPDDTTYIDEYLEKKFIKIYACKGNKRITVNDFVERKDNGTFLITMSGHITCCVDGCIYDTFNPGDRYIWGIYKVK